MKVVYNSDLNRREIGHPVLTPGNFDGVHLGHQDLLKRLKNRAGELCVKSAVYTFEPHPLKIVSLPESPLLLTTIEEKITLIESFGVDYLICIDFTSEFAKQHPKEFVKDILVDNIRVMEVVVGYDYTFGRGKAGTTAYLKRLGDRFGFGVQVVPAFKIDNHVVSSSTIRQKILDGDVKGAARLLGRYYSFCGNVVKGRGRGRKLGFPTANINPCKELIPKEGVYAVYVKIGEKCYNGVVNIGFKPTFEEVSLSIEAHIIDSKMDLYEESLEVFFVERLRAEKAFSSSVLLREGIKEDIERTRSILNGES